MIAKDPRPKFIVGEDCPICNGKGYISGLLDADSKEPCMECDLTGKAEPRYEVFAASQDEANRAYETYKEPF